MPDSVFVLEPSYTEKVEAVLNSAGVRSGQFGVVTISSESAKPPAYPKLLSSLKPVVAGLLDEGIVRRILIVVQVDGPNGSDLDGSRRLLGDLSDSRCTLVSEDLSPTEFMALYARSSFVLGCRLHSAIFGLLGGVPAFPISAARSMGVEKAEGVFESLELQEWVLNYPAFDPHHVLEMLRRTLGSQNSIERVAHAVRRARIEVEEISSILTNAVR